MTAFSMLESDMPDQPATPDNQENEALPLENLVPVVDDHVEEVSENGKKVRRKGVYLLPNLFTTAALFAGFFAVINAMNGQFETAAIAIFVAMILDSLDGRVARLTNTQSAFGAEYDSLSDMVSFGVAPALVAFSWALHSMGKFGWAAAFIYVAGAALRLARFNTQVGTADKRYFTGLASPSAAAVVAGMVWVCYDAGFVGDALPAPLALIATVVTLAAGLAMVTNIRYHSFKGLDFKGRVPFVVILLMVFVFSVVMLDPPKILLAIFALYALSGPLQYIWERTRGAAPPK